MKSLIFLSALGLAKAYWLMGIEDIITTERIDPIVNPNQVSGHVHSVLGGSNFGFNVTTEKLRQSECTSIPIPQDKSNYWYPHLYFQWNNGSFSSMNGGAVIYYLFSDTPGTTTAFPDDFRMLSGSPTLRTYDANSFAQQAVTFLCLDFNGVTTRHNSLPLKSCPSGVRAQINFPSCWNGKDLDSSDHKSHVAFMSEGADKGSCKDPKYPVTLPRIFIEVYWSTSEWEPLRSQAMNTTQPFVYSYGDRTGYGYHADFYNGWDKGVLQKAVDNCHCNPYGDPKCCADQGIFDLNQGKTCRITKSVDEQTTGTLPKLPGNNPVQPEGTTATMRSDPVTPAILAPVCAYTGDTAPACGKVVTGATSASIATASSSTTSASTATASSSVDGKSSSSTAVSSSTTQSSATSSTDGSSGSASSATPSTSSSSAQSTDATSSTDSSSVPSSSTTAHSTSASVLASVTSSSTASSTASSGVYIGGAGSNSNSPSASGSSSVASSSAASSTASSGVYIGGAGSNSNSPPASGSSSVASSSAASSTASSTASSGVSNSGTGSSSGSGDSSNSNPPAQGNTSVPSKGQSGSCDIGTSHRKFLSTKHHHHHHHGRSLRRLRRSHH